jgi:hypothetical protein
MGLNDAPLALVGIPFDPKKLFAGDSSTAKATSEASAELTPEPTNPNRRQGKHVALNKNLCERQWNPTYRKNAIRGAPAVEL